MAKLRNKGIYRIVHRNNGNCRRCFLIFEKYPGFHKGLREWFQNLQMKHMEVHISCAGRGKKAQEEALKAGTSKAKWLESAHNFNCAIDIFFLDPTHSIASYDKASYTKLVQPAVEKHNEKNMYGDALWEGWRINWYGSRGVYAFEWPHCEVLNWRDLNWEPVE